MTRLFAPGFLAMALLLAAVAAGCGTDEPPPAATTPAPRQATGDAPARTTTPEPTIHEDAAVVPTRAAKAAGLRYDALVRAYSPVSDRVNYLVAAETLRADAVDAGAGEDIERERFGAVRIELDRMEEVLRTARPRVARVSVNDVDQQHVQRLMLAAIDARLRALRELELALDALGEEDAPDTEVEALVDAWQASWGTSLRHAREATTSMQQARAMLALPPALEESIR